jgi:hypothetical protein
MADVVTTLDPETREQAMNSGQLSRRMQQLYSLALIDQDASFPNNVIEHDNIDPGGSGKRASDEGGGNHAEFFFRVPPKVNEISEPFATTIVATQNGGKYVESHGTIIRNIRIQGTTGLRPNKKSPSIIPLLGISTAAFEALIPPILNPGDMVKRSKIPDDEITGFDDIIFLRNLFRLYSALKQTDERAGRVIMVWRNAKDVDYWVVEPIDFKLIHNSSSPMTYEYQIQLRTLARADFSLGAIEDPLDSILARRRFLSRLQGYSNDITRVLTSIAGGIDRLDGLGVAAVTAVLGPAVALTRGLLAIKESGSKFGSRTIRRAEELSANLDDALDKIFDATQRTTTLSAGATPTSAQRFPLQDPLVRNLRRLQLTLARIITEKSLQDTVSARHIQLHSRIVRSYVTGGSSALTRRPPDTGGSPTFIGNRAPASAVRETTVRVGETIRDIAQRTTGNRGRWHDLALLNDLRAPYVANVASINVLGPGDVILYPVDDSSGVEASTINLGDKSTQDINNQDEFRFGPIQQSYGRDLRLRSATVANDIDLTDLSVGQSGDISTIAGVPNVEQAMKLKFATERGELTVHPRYGSQFPIGSKASSVAFTAFQIDVANTLRSDTRVQTIDQLLLSVVGDVIVANVRLKLIDSNDLLATSFALRRV